MKKRRAMSKSSSKKIFHKGAKKTHRKNLYAKPMRGGYRL